MNEGAHDNNSIFGKAAGTAMGIGAGAVGVGAGALMTSHAVAPVGKAGKAVFDGIKGGVKKGVDGVKNKLDEYETVGDADERILKQTEESIDAIKKRDGVLVDGTTRQTTTTPTSRVNRVEKKQMPNRPKGGGTIIETTTTPTSRVNRVKKKPTSGPKRKTTKVGRPKPKAAAKAGGSILESFQNMIRFM